MADVLIVGGGPGGLLLAGSFEEHRIDYLVLERGKIGQSWRSMRPGMTLLSPSVPGTDWTSLSFSEPLWAMPGTRRPFPSREDFLCYVEKFARGRGLRVREETSVDSARRTPDGFVLRTSRGEMPARFVVIATGASSRPYYPDIPGLRDNPHVLHSSDFFHCRAHMGQNVLVVGAGNSGAEIAIELAGTARVTLSTRGPLRYFSETGELEDIRGTSESLLKECIRFGIIRHREDDPPVSLDGPAVRFRSGDEETFDRVFCATGYRPAWIPVEGGTVRTRADGFPEISRTGESSVAGLYFCGSLARFHRRCAFIHGFRNYTEKVLWDIVDRL